MDNVDRANLNATQRAQLGRFEREYTRSVNRLMSLPNETIRVRPFARTYNGASIGGFQITRREAADNLIGRTFSFRPGDRRAGDTARAYTAGTVGPLGRGHPETHVTDRGLAASSAISMVHDGALHGSAQEYRGGLVAGAQSPLGQEPYRSAHQEPYSEASCQLLSEC